MNNMTFFEKIRNSRTHRIICAFLALNLVIEIVSPTAAMALTAGPTQPEFSSFEPVATTDMVNDFSGDFTYNIPVLSIPGPDGGGYSMSLAYHSGGSSEEEASWVGFGWTLNPGAINRNKRGYADEFYNAEVINYNKSKPSWTQNSKFDFNLEPISQDKKKSGEGDGAAKSGGKFAAKFQLSNFAKPGEGGDDNGDFPVSVSLSHAIRYNNYSGFSISNGVKVSDNNGMGTLSMNRSGASNTLGFSVNPMAIMSKLASQKMEKGSIVNEKKWKTKLGKLNGRIQTLAARLKTKGIRMPTSYSVKSFNVPALGYSVAKNSSASWNFSASIQINPNIPVGFQVGIAGNLNIQANEGKQSQRAYGYMSSRNANNNTVKDRLYDYQVEKETTFNKHDKNLGIPFNNADIFSATGNDVMGGFKFQHDKIGAFYPNMSVSEAKIRQLSIELGIGATFQIGIDIGVGKQKTSVEGQWAGLFSGYATDYTKQVFDNTLTPAMRFSNDMGGEVNYNDDYDKILFATINGDKSLDLSGYGLTLDNTKAGNSSSIKYIQATPNATTQSNTNLVTGIEITSKDGSINKYNRAVYTSNETQFTIGLDNNQDGAYIVKNPLNVAQPLDNKTVVGQTIAEKYASTYLITEKLTYNYIDADFIANPGNAALQGPSDGDFGGWTKFDYRQVWGGANALYHFRTPYAGLNYNPGRMLDDKDQTGSMSSGDKEIHYLKCIETKSHIAFFVTNKTTASNFAANFPVAQYPFLYSGGLPVTTVTTNIEGSGTTRYDGIDAAAFNGGMDDAANDLNLKGTHHLEKLERIVLFAKSDLSKPLSSTFLEYDYSLCQGIPNNDAPANAPAKDKGKLTLKRVWMESNGVNRGQIAPYQFHYEYFNNYPTQIANKYGWAATYNSLPTNDGNQNPLYHSEQLDPWGFYQEDGAQRFADLQPWVSQKTMTANTTFDPAAWQLKRIQLPSGGEIHVNYEQKDYSYVQDKLPMAMVSLQDIDTQNGYKSDESVYCIKTSDLDITNATDALNYKNTLVKHFITYSNKLYFKVLYAYTGDDEPKLNMKGRRYEYVTGYTTVNEITMSGNNILLHLGEIRPDNTASNLLGAGKADKTLPRYVCYQECLGSGGQNLGMNAGSYKDDDYTNQAYAHTPVDADDLKIAARQNVLSNTLNMFKDWTGGLIKNAPKKEVCKNLNFNLSYFKVPVYHAKRGGGIRVKRILTYDQGIAGEGVADATVFGSEYIYQCEDGTSSGIASNEPSSIREENALVSYVERKKQKFMDKILNGRDTKQFEGFLGENVLPGAEVSHSRIVVKNIRDGKSTSGYAVSKYHTCKDFPVEVDYSDISKNNDTYKKLSLNVPLGIFNMSTNRAWVTQGYIFKLNDMHGKIASKTNYPGIYNAAAFTTPANVSTKYNEHPRYTPAGMRFFDQSAPDENREPSYTSKTTYNYSAPGEKIASMVYDAAGTGSPLKRKLLSPGTEEDFTIFQSYVEENSNDFSIEVDLNLSFPPPVLTIGFGVSFSVNNSLLAQHITSKVVSKKSYLMSTTNVSDGVTQTTENLAFDRYTGDPVLTRTFDGYMAPDEKIYTSESNSVKKSGYIYSMNIPASWMYSTMGPISQSTVNTNQLTAMAGNIVTYGQNNIYDALITPTAALTSWMTANGQLDNVISATATTYTNGWFDAGMNSDYAGLSNTTVLAAANKFYYPIRSYSYRDAVSDANAANNAIYKSGTVNGSVTFFNWGSPSVPSTWYSDSKATRYSPFGYAIEEEDALTIKSSARYGYQNTLPVSIAQNAAFSETRFTDFEYGMAPNVTTTNLAAHSGLTAFDLSASHQYIFANGYYLSAAVIQQRGLGIKLWLRSNQSTVLSSPNYGLKNPQPKLKAVIGTQLFDFKAIAQTGDWTLYSADIKNFNGLTAGLYNIKLDYNYLTNEQVFVDDFRIQPLDASMNCSVYYADNKLAAQFDDQHFGTYYEYNNKGQLIRKSIETERGKKTLQEQQYNTPLINR